MEDEKSAPLQQTIGKLQIPSKKQEMQAIESENVHAERSAKAVSQKQSVRQKRLQKMQKEGAIAGIMRTVNLKLQRRPLTTSALEKTIYDKSSLRPGDNLLMEQDLFLVDGGDEVEAPPALFHFIDDNIFAADLVLLLSVLGTCFFTPLTFIWGGHPTSASARVPGGSFTFVCDFIMDLLYMGHLVLILNTSFMHESRRVEVVDRLDIIKHYLQRPYYWIKLLGTTSYVWIILGAPCLINNIKAIRIYHFMKLPDSFWKVGEMAAFKMLQPILLIYVVAHWLACLLACLGGYREMMERDGIASFRTEFDGNAMSDWLSAYCMAFIEALYMLTGSLDNPLGDGGPREKNFGGLLIVAIFGPVGCVGVAIFISSIIRQQALASVLEIRHAENKAFLLRALENLDIPMELQRRVFSLHYFQKMSHDYEAFEHLFSQKNLSAPVESALRVYLYQESVLSARYFKDKDPNYILEVVRVLEDVVFLPGDYVARCGEVGTQMYFIARGRLCVLVPHKDARTHIDCAQEIRELNKGEYFGDVALLKDCVRTAWVRAECYCILSMLTRAAIEDIWKYFPREREDLIESVKKRLNEYRMSHAQKLWSGAARTSLARALDKVATPKGADREQPPGDSTGKSDTTACSVDDAATEPGILAASATSNAARASEKPADEEEGASDLEEQAEVMKGKPQAMARSDESMACIERVEKACETLLNGQLTLQKRAEELQERVAALSEVQTALTDAFSWASATFRGLDPRMDCDGETLEFSDGVAQDASCLAKESSTEVALDASSGTAKNTRPAKSTRDGRKKKVAPKTKNKLSTMAPGNTSE